MDSLDVLVVEPDTETRNRVGRTLKALAFEPIVSGSLAEAQERVRGEEGHLTAIIADVAALLPQLSYSQPGDDWATRVPQLRAGVERLRTLYTRRAPQRPDEHAEPAMEVPVILTSAEDDAAVHAAAIEAGAEAFLRAVEIGRAEVLGSYLARYDARRRAEVVRRAARPRPIAETFDLPDDDLRNGQSGRWDAKRIAPVLGVDLTDVVRAIDVKYSTVARTPDSEALQPKLGPFANVITMLRQVYGAESDPVASEPPGDAAAGPAGARTDERLRMWLRRPHPALRGRTPLDALLEPGRAPAVEQWVTRVWLGDPA